MHPTDIRTWLARTGGGANKRLGQHFLMDDEVLQAVVDAAHVRNGDRILEIGPGLGVLTEALLARGAVVSAIERDRRFTSVLEERLAEAITDNRLTITCGDAVHVAWTMNEPWKFVSNLPYQITSIALRKALWSDHPPTELVVLIQREVAERIVAQDDKQSLLSLMVGLSSSSAEIVRLVPPEAFYPPPKVESAVLRLTPLSAEDRRKRWGIDPERVMALAKKGFAHPRKRLASNLGFDVACLGFSTNIRAEDVPLNGWIALARSGS